MMEKEQYLSDLSFKRNESFKNEIWFSSPTIHGEEQKWDMGHWKCKK